MIKAMFLWFCHNLLYIVEYLAMQPLKEGLFYFMSSQIL